MTYPILAKVYTAPRALIVELGSPAWSANNYFCTSASIITTTQIPSPSLSPFISLHSHFHPISSFPSSSPNPSPTPNHTSKRKENQTYQTPQKPRKVLNPIKMRRLKPLHHLQLLPRQFALAYHPFPSHSNIISCTGIVIKIVVACQQPGREEVGKGPVGQDVGCREVGYGERHAGGRGGGVETKGREDEGPGRY